MSEPRLFDIAIIGGGVNGCGIARDAAGRGASVVLFEQGDLASGTSSVSTKLIHGGLRYLEHLEFFLVGRALRERERLLAIAPHLVRPLRFVLPHHKGLRPAWLLGLGLVLYDHLGGARRLPGSRRIDLTSDEAGRPLKPQFRRGLEYSDCRVDDARLVVLNARDAADRGADIHPATAVTEAIGGAAAWTLRVRDARGAERSVRARVLVNAAGPWAGAIARMAGIAAPKLRLVQGSHIVVPRLFTHDRAYIFQNTDGRVVFAIPYEQAFTLIGTTDVDYEGPLAKIAASAAEIDYLCAAASAYFEKPVRPAQVRWTYSGARALVDDGASRAQEATRDYVLDLHLETGAPFLSVLGGKITTYRQLAEAALDKLKPYVAAARKPRWTARVPLPGGDFAPAELPVIVSSLRAAFPYLAPDHALRLVRAYGTRSFALLTGTDTLADLGENFGADLRAREVDYLRQVEWARTADDILWRRSKLGLWFSEDQTARLAAYLEKAGPSVPADP